MSPKQKFNYARDQAFQKYQNYDSVKLPPKIRCDVCKKNKTSELGFSKKKQQDLRKAIATGRINPNKENGGALGAICRECSGTQKFEMTCSICHYVKGLDGFSKAQRKTPDTARCIRCIAMIEQEDPVEGTATEEYLRRLAEDSDEDDDDYDDGVTNPYGENSDWGTYGGVSVSSQYSSRVTEESLAKLNLGGKQVVEDDEKSVGTSSWKEFASNPGAANASNHSNSTPGRPWTAYDPNGRGYAMHQASSVTDTDDSYATTARSTTTPRDMPERNTKFAKARAVKQKKELPTYSGGKPALDEDEDEDDEDEDDFFTI